MTDLKDAIQLLLDTGAEQEEIKWEYIDGRYYTKQNLMEFAKEPMAEPIVASTLDAMTEYVTKCQAEMPEDMIIHITSPTNVVLESQLNQFRMREVLFVSESYKTYHLFDTWMDQEEFMTYLASSFETSEDKELLLKYVGMVEVNTVATYGDDRISQRATISTRIASKASVVLPSTVNLAPYRTFLEIPQPQSPFIFRISDGDEPKFKLVLADGGAWRLQAMDEIAVYIAASLPQDANITILR